MSAAHTPGPWVAVQSMRGAIGTNAAVNAVRAIDDAAGGISGDKLIALRAAVGLVGATA